MDTEWLVGGDLYFRERELTEYQEDTQGVGLRIGHPLAPYLDGTIGYKVDDTNLTLKPEADQQLYPVETVNGLTSAATASLVYDTRDDRFSPSGGSFASVALEYAGLGGDIEYTKGMASARYYKKVFWDVVWRNNLNYGIVTPGRSGEDVPFNQLFRLGGPNSLRGFDGYNIGKRKFSEKEYGQLLLSPSYSAAEAFKLAFRPFGGTQQLYYNMEFQFPLVNEAGIKGVVFYDIGYADDDFALDEFRSNWGFGFRWFSPIGPLRFEFGLPFDRQEIYGERAVNFHFAIGSPF